MNDPTAAAPGKPVHFVTRPASRIAGRLRVPGDKSISHRALMFGALADGVTGIDGFLPGEDCLATMAALRAMGVSIEHDEPSRVRVHGVGIDGLQAPGAPLDMGNSGTAMRLFAGLLSGQRFDSQLTGDGSLLKRPMARVTDPLQSMGARIEATGAQGRPPLTIRGGARLHGIEYALPVASAQVKSALLLAGLYAEGETAVIEPAVTRDHTERMLMQFGCPVAVDGNRISMTAGQRLQATPIDVPADLSSAAFFLLAGLLARDGELILDNVGLNPTRTGVLEIFRLMGGDFTIDDRQDNGEPTGTLTVRPSRLCGIEVPAELVPLAIDEFPLVFVAAAVAEGETVVTGAEELRFKESDRIGVMADGLAALGIDVETRPDGAVIHGGTLGGGEVDSAGDHRIAMAFAIGGSVATDPVRILDCANVATSYPGFVDDATAVGLDINTGHG